MLKTFAATLLTSLAFAGSVLAQETTVKFTLGWKTQAPMPPSSSPATRATSRPRD